MPGRLEVAASTQPGARAHADAEAVVLADDQQRERQALVGAVPGGVERAHRGGVVDRGVAQAGHHDRVGGPAAGGAQPGGAAQREGEPDRARQMRRRWSRSAG